MKMLEIGIPAEIHSWLGQFKSAPLEEAYRETYLDRDRLQAIIIVGLLLIFNLLFISSDKELLGNEQPIYHIILAVRLFLTLFNLFYFYLLLQFKEPKQFDRVTFLALISTCSAILYIDSTRPPTFFFHLLIDITIIFSIYIFFPTQLILQIITATYFSLGVCFILLTRKNIPHVAEQCIWSALLFANFFWVFG
ncbi:hypothetical protein Ctha_1763 [Chloroherpeton thalassium ATCC 35110]|uniref:Uncharacterized protein n=1 Tax=Chloroherpeton thalassium (strain ATCC 35110 / GB-78) TaxID=517418 RepID=B3QTC1_CHLT3|nr:hypothetical protein [Chloroherpeton thalassium]ACF14220.1 hypothetical protein Ctha_1763 [Chloroherpeton thalassium ATCC 35110]